MISTVIIDHIATNVPDLTTGENLFAEQSKGNQCVTVITRDLTSWPGMPENFRKALIEIEVRKLPHARRSRACRGSHADHQRHAAQHL